MYFAGIDIGSTMTKTVIMDQDVQASVIGPTGPEHRHMAHTVMQEALKRAGIEFDDLSYVIATGYGRINVPFADKQITEISCHAMGVASLFPSARTVIDIGGQDAKGIKIENGRVADFVMNDKCAAGTGRFLEVIADTLKLPLKDIGELSLKATRAVEISSKCTIFAEEEIVARLSEGVLVEDIMSGLHQSIAGRVIRMCTGLKIEKDVVFTGGVAKNIGMVKAMENYLGFPVLIPEEPLLTGAIGAAILCKQYVEKALKKGTAIQRVARELGPAGIYFN
jgi:predicted CoA-substrate-specific enzyme activase